VRVAAGDGVDVGHDRDAADLAAGAAGAGLESSLCELLLAAELLSGALGVELVLPASRLERVGRLLGGELRAGSADDALWRRVRIGGRGDPRRLVRGVL
jgi:hypothetical protein